MALTTRPAAKPQKSTSEPVEAFINSAPDGLSAELKREVARKKRVQISHTLPERLLVQVDDLAERKGLTRAGLVNLAISEFLERH